MSLDPDTEEEKFASRAEREVKSWRPFAEALRYEDRVIFKEMLNSVFDYGEAIERAERGYDTESLLMVIILNQQKAINWLSSTARKLREESETRTRRSAAP